VSPTGKDSNDGSEASPFLTLPHAVKVMAPLDAIFLFPGNYPEVNCKVGLLRDGTKLSSWKGTAANTIIVCANSTMNVVGKNTVFENIGFTLALKTALSVSGELTINNGAFTFNYGRNGVAIHAQAGATVKVSSTEFSKNDAQYSVIELAFGSVVTFDKVKFLTNNGDSGIVSANGASMITFTNSIFQDNTAKNGGAISVANTDHLKVEKCTFTGNRALREGGSIYMATSKFDIVESTFTKNVVGAHGGALNIVKASSGTISTCTFDSNDAEYGGAFAGSLSAIVSSNNKFTNNRAYQGGDIYLSETAVYNEDKGIHSGCFAHRGGSVYSKNSIITIVRGSYTNSTGDFGGAFYNAEKSDVKLQNTVVENNRSQKGAGIYCSGSKMLLKESTLKNNLVANLQCENCEIVDEKSACDCTKC